MAYALLAVAIITEVFGTTMLKLSDGFTKIYPILAMIAGFFISFYLLALSLVDLSLVFAYATWSGAGTVLTVLVGMLLFKEKINKQGLFGIGLLLIGIILLNLAD